MGRKAAQGPVAAPSRSTGDEGLGCRPREDAWEDISQTREAVERARAALEAEAAELVRVYVPPGVEGAGLPGGLLCRPSVTP